MRIGIVGGGLTGIALAYFLTRQGITVEVFEAAPELGGLARQATLADGARVDRFYHTILASDRRLRQLCADLGMAESLAFSDTRMGFYHEGQIHPMDNMVDFLRFPPLRWVDRLRLGATVLHAQQVRDWQQLERVNVQDWLIRWSGRRTFQNIWRPLLAAKFDGSFDNTPATYIWARLVRTKSTRSGVNQKERAGYLPAGYVGLMEAMASRVMAAGGAIHLGAPVDKIVIHRGAAEGLQVGGRTHGFDAVAATTALPAFRQMIPDAGESYRRLLGQTEYMGLICPLLVLDRPLSGFWTLNITDEAIPFTGVIETTTYIDPRWVGGRHLVYLPKYTAPGSRWQQMSDGEIRSVWLASLETMFPGLEHGAIREFLVHREQWVEPIHGLDSSSLIPRWQTAVQKLYLVTTAQIYPALTNGESVVGHAHQCATQIVAALAS
ncbi:MAG: NAD(P)/FAD-dependent oxidoreductase [Chloroflexi bacterium]|nr:NAD(P)/FAD-dependent oxidoreductase [Chloroflexota bacterium]